MKAHLLIFDNEQISLTEMIKIVDDMSEILNWHVVFDNAMCIASEASAKSLAGTLDVRLPHIRYLISEVQPEKKGGRMNRSILTLLNAPGPVQREPA